MLEKDRIRRVFKLTMIFCVFFWVMLSEDWMKILRVVTAFGAVVKAVL